MITSLLLIPIIGSFILIAMDENSTGLRSLGSSNHKKMKQIAITTSLINLIISIFMWINFDSSSTQYQFVYEFNKLSFFDFNLGVDSISLYFVLLTTFLTPIA